VVSGWRRRGQLDGVAQAIAHREARDDRQSAAIGLLADSAQVMLAGHTDDRTGDDETDALRDLASGLWSKVQPRCPYGDNPTMRALALIQAKLS